MNDSGNGDALIETRGLVKRFPVRSGAFGVSKYAVLRAVDGVDLAMRRGEPLAWSANRAAASRPPAGCCCASSSRAPDRSATRSPS